MPAPADIKAIFLAAADQPPSERAAYLDAACGGDSDLRRRIEALLKAHDDTGGWLGEPATPTSDYPGFTAPSVEELAPLFPQLEILEILGRGGMGAVYKARQKNLDRFVALKILPHDSGDAAFAERFTREARTLAKLNHPGIVAVHDFGTANGLYWFVMEYVDGVNLRQAKKAGTLTPDAALAVVPRICEALQFAHDAGIVHRDIKPENVLLDAKGRVKIADFGLAKLIDPDRSHLTGTHQAMGTPHYMAPEQWERPLEVDHRADIYSLGVVFYELLTGELPLGRFAPPSQKVQIDVRLDEVVLRTLEKEPARRYQQASEVKTDLERISDAPTPAVPDVAAVKPQPSQPSFFRQVVVPVLAVIAGAALISSMVYGSFLEESWQRMDRTAVAVVIGVDVAIVVFAVQLVRWFARRRRQSPIQTLIDGACFLRLNFLATWVMIVCGLGAANVLTPWVIASTMRQQMLFWGIDMRYDPAGITTSGLFALVGLLVFLTAPSPRMRPWRAVFTVIAGVALLVMSISVITSLWGGRERIMRMELISALGNEPLFHARAFLGPYVAALLAGLLLVLGAIDLRAWLAVGANSQGVVEEGLAVDPSQLSPDQRHNLDKEPQRRSQQASEVPTDLDRIGRTEKTPIHPAPARLPAARRISLFWTVILPTLLLTTIAAGAAMYVLVGIEGPAAAHEMQGKTAILGANVALVVFVILLFVWFRRRQPGSVTRSVISMWRFCRLDSLTTWAIIVCVIGLANSLVPWLQLTAWVNHKPLSHSWQLGWQSGFNRLLQYCGPIANALFPVLGLFLLATGGVRSRSFKAIVTLLTGGAILTLSIVYIKGADGNPNSVPYNPDFFFVVQPHLGAYIAMALGAVLLLVGAIELRGWLASRGEAQTSPSADPVSSPRGARGDPLGKAAVAGLTAAFAAHIVPWGYLLAGSGRFQSATYPIGITFWWSGAPSAVLLACAGLFLSLAWFLRVSVIQQSILRGLATLFALMALGFQAYLLVVGLGNGWVVELGSEVTTFVFRPEWGLFATMGLTILGVVLALLATMDRREAEAA